MNRSWKAIVRGCTMLLTVSVIFGGRPALATPIVYDFTGVVTNESPGYGPTDVNVANVGDPITGSFSYDSGLVATASTVYGTTYQGYVGLGVTIGSRTFDLSSPLVAGVGVSHNDPEVQPGDAFHVSVLKTLDPVTGLRDAADIDFYDPTGTSFTNESLPTSLDLTKLNGAIVVQTADGSSYLGDINTLTPESPAPVPEPATLGIFLVVLVVCAARRTGVRLGTAG